LVLQSVTRATITDWRGHAQSGSYAVAKHCGQQQPQLHVVCFDFNLHPGL